ncbi:MAG: 3-hydroxybutyryl-CoA dehydrogenase [Bacteroidia bacterium]|nr:3-hydroxybutyryl-CoA dehydrogenase [Bacteroidia bacterium]MBP6649901.1 3-hydroxybutyryl-CoA dehydrogenase [Bacteroidia bacterium]
MTNLNAKASIGILGAGTMGSGIAQVAASAGHPTILFDSNPAMLEKSKTELNKTLSRLLEKSKITKEESDTIIQNIRYANSMSEMGSCKLIVEAILEDLSVKQQVVKELEEIVGDECILASNTSSLSITSIAGAARIPSRIIGLHFFNPAPLMPLVEIIPGLATNPDLLPQVKRLMLDWKKSPVFVKDTPGFIVNRVARPYYGESIRIYEERWNDLPEGPTGFATIDWAMKEFGGFRMGPFELMDMIGNDINFTVTETVWKQFFHDPKFKPSLTQKRLVEAKRFGKKSGQGYYNYIQEDKFPEPFRNEHLGKKIKDRVLAMLINEAVDAVYLNVASCEDIDLAMTKGVNYPKGLLKWCDEWGASNVLAVLEDLHREYSEERYRPSVLLRRMAKEKSLFYQ